MYKILFSIGLFLIPTFAFASCSSQGTTVVYINGINTSRADAYKDLKELENKFDTENNAKSFSFIDGYNESYGQGLDVWRLTSQMLAWDPNSWHEDITGDILLDQLHSDLATQKVVLVGYSQGAFYANETYKYLTEHGLSTASVANFDVGTPASYVAGNGVHLTSTNDAEIAEVRRLAEQTALPQPLPANITIPVSSADNTGHQFATRYLAGAGEQIVDTIAHDADSLLPAGDSNLAGCFVAPPASALHKTQLTLNNIGTLLGTAGYITEAAVLNGTIAAVDSGVEALGQVATDVEATIGGLNGLAHASDPKYQGTNYNIVNKLYAGHEQTVDGESLQDLIGGNQGGAVILALGAPLEPQATATTTASTTPVTNAPMTDFLIPINTTPGFGGGGGGGGGGGDSSLVVSDPAPEDVVDDTTSTSTIEEASSTPPGVVFDQSLLPPGLVVDQCTSSIMQASCWVSDPSVQIEWNDIGAVYYDVLVNNTVVASTTQTSAAVQLADGGDNTVQVVAYDSVADTLQSNTVHVLAFSTADTGFFCNGDTSVLTPQDTAVSYRALNNNCLYVGGFSSVGNTLRAEVYKGTVGSSTIVDTVGTNSPFNKLLLSNHYDFSGSFSGDNYFVALYDYNNNIGGGYNAFYIPDMEYYLTTGVQTDGLTQSPPPLSYYLIPFVIP